MSRAALYIVIYYLLFFFSLLKSLFYIYYIVYLIERKSSRNEMSPLYVCVCVCWGVFTTCPILGNSPTTRGKIHERKKQKKKKPPGGTTQWGVNKWVARARGPLRIFVRTQKWKTVDQRNSLFIYIPFYFFLLSLFLTVRCACWGGPIDFITLGWFLYVSHVNVTLYFFFLTFGQSVYF